LLRVLAEDRDRLRVGEEISDVARRAGGVDRHPDGADAREREVEQRTLPAVPGEQGDVVAASYAAREEAVRIGTDALVGVLPGDFLPPLGGLHQVRRVGTPGREGVPATPRRRRPV